MRCHKHFEILVVVGLALAALGISPAALAQTASAALPRLPESLFFDRARTELVKPYRDTLFVTDVNGVPKFRADLRFVLKAAANTEGYIIEWRVLARRVRLSIDPTLDYWVSCDDIIATGLACGTAKAITSGLILRAPEPKAPVRGGELSLPPEIPDCPGDARCPKLKKRK